MGVPKAGGRSLRLRSGFAGKRQLDEKRQMLHRYQLRKNQWQSARVTKCSQAVGRQGIEAPLFNPIVALDTALFIVAWQENRLGLDQGVFSQQLAGFLRPLAIGLNMTEEVHHFAHALCRLPPLHQRKAGHRAAHQQGRCPCRPPADWRCRHPSSAGMDRPGRGKGYRQSSRRHLPQPGDWTWEAALEWRRARNDRLF